MKPLASLFSGRIHPGDLEFTSEYPRGGQEIGGAPPPTTRRTPLSRGPLEHLPTDFFRLYSPTYPKTSTEKIDRELRRRKPL